MTKSVAIILGSILLVSLGIFSVMQVKKLDDTKSHLTEKLSNITTLEEDLERVNEEKTHISDLNSDLKYENEILRDSIAKLNQIIANLRRKVHAQDQLIEQLRNKVHYLQMQYDQKKQEIAVLSRKEESQQEAIAKIEQEKAEIKQQMNQFKVEEQNSFTIKLEAETEIKEKMDSQAQFQKIDQNGSNWSTYYPINF